MGWIRRLRWWLYSRERLVYRADEAHLLLKENLRLRAQGKRGTCAAFGCGEPCAGYPPMCERHWEESQSAYQRENCIASPCCLADPK